MLAFVQASAKFWTLNVCVTPSLSSTYPLRSFSDTLRAKSIG
jgi:hypothetical protein